MPLRPYFLHGRAVAVGAGATIELPIDVGDFPFVGTAISVLPGQGLNSCRINIRDHNGLSVFSGRIPDGLMSGNGGTPLSIDNEQRPGTQGLVLAKNTQVVFEIENTDGADNTVDCVIQGFQRR